MTDRPNAADLAEHARQWRQNPSLLELWWGVRAAQYLRPFRSDHLIFDLLFATDISFAAQLLESYPSPLEPKLIFDLGWHGPRSSFAIWKGLMEAARLAFDADGDWNGCFLLPLLLRIAQDELGQEADEAERATVVDEVRRVLFQRSDGPPAALRWGAWLFRTSMRRLNRSQHEPAAGKESAPDWRLTEALFKSPQAGIWQQTQPRDCPAEEEWCLAAMRILAANCHDIVLPHIDLLAEALPREPEAFLDGPDGARLRELPSLFVHLDGRPDGLGFRILALPLVSVAAKQFSALWQQTLALREIVEHRTLSFDEGDAADDAARPASEMIQAVLSVGLCLVDLVQTPANTVSSGNPHTKTLSLLRTLHEATSEMLAIDPVRARNWELLHDHLCARRLLYEERSTVASGIAAPLKRTDQPTLGELLASRLGLSLSFLNCLRTLRANGVEVDRIREELAAIGVDFELLLRQIAQHDAIEATRKIDPEHFLVPPQER
jgi:hypothetical protein